MSKGISLAIGFGEFIGVLVALAIVIIIFRFLAGDVIKFELEKELYEETGRAINMLNVIATSSELVIKDSTNQPEKGVLSREKLVEASGLNKELDCCSYVDYDYFLQVKILNTGETFDIGFPSETIESFFDLGKKCGQISKDKSLRSYSIPLVISEGDKRYSGEMKINLVKTPLSSIANGLAIACSKNNYESQMSFYGLPQTTNGVKIEGTTPNYKICVLTSDGLEMCKNISCDLSIDEVNEETSAISDEELSDGCYHIKITSSEGKVILYVPNGF